MESSFHLRHRLCITECPSRTLWWLRRLRHCHLRSMETGMSANRLKPLKPIERTPARTGELANMKIATTVSTVDAPTTPHGFWRFSANYLLAAKTVEVKIHEEGQLFFPTLQLYGITIKLSFKAFLLKRGLTPNPVRDLSHDLTKTLKLARRHKLGAKSNSAAAKLQLSKYLMRFIQVTVCGISSRGRPRLLNLCI